MPSFQPFPLTTKDETFVHERVALASYYDQRGEVTGIQLSVSTFVIQHVYVTWDDGHDSVESPHALVLLEPLDVDMVNHPPHYTFGKFEVIDVLEDWFSTEPLLWQTSKYIARWDKKGDPIENLEKAQFYLQRKIDKLKAEQS